MDCGDSVGEAGMRIVVVGLGNDVLGDDGAGLEVVRRLAGRIDGVDLFEAPVGGLGLLDIVVGYDAAVIVDTFEGENPGYVKLLSEREAFGEPLAGCVHDCSFGTALEMGRRVGLAVPDEVVVVAIEVSDTKSFREGLTEEVKGAVEEAVEKVLHIVRGFQRRSTRHGGSA